MYYLFGTVSKMEIKPAGRIPFSEKVWNDYKERLAFELAEKAYDVDVIFNDPDLKNYIINYMENEIVTEKKDTERLILGTNIRLAHLDVETSKGKRTFPIVNTYKGHHLLYTEYFYKDEDSGECKMGRIEVQPSKIIIP